MLIDSHCHLDFPELSADLANCLAAMAAQGVRHALCAGVTLERHSGVLAIVEPHAQLFASVGVHPEETGVREPSVDELVALAAHPKVIAIGETGLDYFYTPETKTRQQASFRHHIRIGRELNKPVIVHTRDARADTLAILEEEKVTDCGGVLHCFTEDRETAGKLLDMGFYISFSGIVTFRNAEQLREAARYVPLDRMLVETDSPYLAPVPHRGKENQPAMTRDVAEYMAVLKGVSLEELARATTENFASLFHIDPARLQSV